MVYVMDLLKLDTFKDFTLVSGESGLDRRVSWPNVAQTVSIREWLVGGDVILMSGVGLQITDEFLTDIVIQAADGRAACIIMLINPEHISYIPQQAVDEAVQRGFAVFAAPWETKLSRVIGSVSLLVSNDRLEESMHSEFLDRLLSGEINYDDNVFREMIKKYGLLDKNIVVVTDYRFNRKYTNTENQSYYNDHVMREMIHIFRRYFDKINYLNQYNRQAFVIGVSDSSEKDIISRIHQIYDTFMKENQSVCVRIGIGGISHEPEELKKSFNQARVARKAVNKSGVLYYKELGIYQLLFYIDDTSRIEEYVKCVIKPLLDYDEKNEQNLVDTLREYLVCGQNVSQAAQRLYIHRNTMIKRIEKIESLLGYSIKDAEIYNQLYNVMKIMDLFLRK